MAHASINIAQIDTHINFEKIENGTYVHAISVN